MRVLSETQLNPPAAVSFLFVDNDPRTEGGVRRGVGSIAIAGDGSMYKKTGTGDTDWTPLLEATNQVAVLTKTVTLTDAQIKALPTTSVDIVPAPSAGRMLVPFAAAFITNFDAAGYTNVDPGAWVYLQWGSDWASHGPSHDFASVKDANGSILTFGGQQFFPVVLGTANDGNGSNFPPGDVASKFAGKPISAYVINGVLGNLTGGDPANTLTVTVLYAVVDV